MSAFVIAQNCVKLPPLATRELVGETFLARHPATLNKIKDLSVNKDRRMNIDQAACSRPLSIRGKT